MIIGCTSDADGIEYFIESYLYIVKSYCYIGSTLQKKYIIAIFLIARLSAIILRDGIFIGLFFQNAEFTKFESIVRNFARPFSCVHLSLPYSSICIR